MPVANQESIQASLAALEKDPALSQKDFSNIVKAFCFHPEQGRFLLETNRYNPKLAETLLIFRRMLAEATAKGKDLEPVAERLFLHYIVNTNGPIQSTEGSDSLDVFEAATRYAAWLNVGVSKDANGESILQLDDKEIPCPAWGAQPGVSTAWTLRKVGPVINRARYGRDDVIPSNAFGFDENAVSHSLENAMTLADLAHLAYFKPSYVEKQLKEWGYESFRWIEATDTDSQAFVAGKGQHLVVCFRGTSSGTDAITDLSFFKTDAFGGRGKVHRGFNGALESVWSKVQTAVDALGKNKKLFICGHSLGAALAQLAAHRFALKGYSVAHVYVYGSPRIGNRDFKEAYNELLGEKTFLHINNSDIVTQVPMELLGFHHVGISPRIFNEGHIIRMPSAAKASKIEAKEKDFDKLPKKKQEAIEQQMFEVQQSIAASTRFLRTNPAQMSFGGYDTQFEAGIADEHSMDQYLFKFACAIVSEELLQIGKAVKAAK